MDIEKVLKEKEKALEEYKRNIVELEKLLSSIEETIFIEEKVIPEEVYDLFGEDIMDDEYVVIVMMILGLRIFF